MHRSPLGVLQSHEIHDASLGFSRRPAGSSEICDRLRSQDHFEVDLAQGKIHAHGETHPCSKDDGQRVAIELSKERKELQGLCLLDRGGERNERVDAGQLEEVENAVIHSGQNELVTALLRRDVILEDDPQTR